MKSLLLFSTLICALGCSFLQAQEQDSEIVNVGNAKFLRWHGHTGRTYFLQVADPNALLEKWMWAPVIETGNDENISYEVNTTAQKAFFRLKYTDQATTDPDGDDFDNDGLSNLEEITLHQTDPINPDSDADGLPDGWEVAHGISPLDDGSLLAKNGAAGQFQNSELTNAEAYALGVTAHPSATIADHDGDGLGNNIDADPRQRLIDWERAPEVSYAVIDLSMNALESFLPPHGRFPVRAVLNDHGEICREPYFVPQERTPAHWNGLSYPVTWNHLQDLIISTNDPENFAAEGFVSYNNVGNVYHGIQLEGEPNNVQGVQNLTVAWSSANSAPALFGDHPSDTSISRGIFSRFDYTSVDETRSSYPNFDGYQKKITAKDFELNVTGSILEDLPYMVRFNYYSHAPSITRTGKVLIYQDENYKINDLLVPSSLIYGLCADPKDRDLITITDGLASNQITSLSKYAESWKTLPTPGIVDMNEAGTAITFPEHQVWVNGETIILDELLEYSGWSQFKAEQINEDGLILGSAMPDGGIDHKAVLLVPLNFDVYPPEPTADEIAAAGEDNWEVETFQIPADDPQFWVQANIMVPGKDDEGKPTMVPAEDGTEVTWEIDADVSASGASLSSTTTTTENGHTAVLFTASTTPRDRFKISAKLTKLKWKTGAQHAVATYADPDGFHTIKTQFFEVVPGNVNSIAVTAPVTSLPADEASEVVLQAVLTDAAGNPAARGTDVTWHVSGGGKIKQRDHLVSEENGTVAATLVAGSIVGSQKITVEADGVEGEITMNNTPVQVVSMSSSASSLDIASGQTATITLQTSGVADGAQVTWKNSLGTILQKSAAIHNNSAQAIIRADSGVIGNAVVWATVGDSITHCNVAFTSSAVVSMEVNQPLLVFDESTDGVGTIPTLSGGTENIPYYANSNLKIRSPGNPNAWATVSFSGSSRNSGFTFPFDEGTNQLSPSSPAGTNATLANGAAIVTGQDQIQVNSGILALPSVTATATIPHASSLSLAEGSRIRFALRPMQTGGNVITKQAEYSAALMADGRLKFTVGVGQGITEVMSAEPLSLEKWHDINVFLEEGHLMMDIAGSLTSTPLLSVPVTSTHDVVIGGCIGFINDLRYIHQQSGLQGISIISGNLNAQNQVQLNANGEATIQIRPLMVGQGPPPELLAQTVDVKVQVGNQQFTAKNAVAVTNKGTAVLIRAIAGKTACIGTDVSSATDRAGIAKEFLMSGVKEADRTGAIPEDMGADAVARGEAGYLIAIWMEETVDEAGIVHPIMSVSAQNLPAEIADVLNWMLTEMMVSASQRHSSHSFSDYITHHYKELLLALQSLSAGDIDKFLTIAKVVDGKEGIATTAAVAEQVGHGVIAAMAESSLQTVGSAYDSLRALIGKQNWGVELRDRHEAAEAARKLQKNLIEAVAGTAANSKQVIKQCSDYLLQQQLIDPEGAAALGFAYGVVESIDQLGQDAVQPELLAKTAIQLADLTISAVGGDAQAKEALKEIGSLAAIAPISAIPEAQAHWDQGNYFQAGASSVAVVEVALVAKFVKDLAVKATNKALRWGRHRTTDWQANNTTIGFKAEALAFQRLKSKGFRDIVPIRNASNHGIDWVCKDKSGGIVFIEVKGHRLDAAPELKGPQKDMKAFTESRLDQAVKQTGHWKNVSKETRENAERILDQLKSPNTKVTGYVVNVDYAVSKLPRLRYYEWLNGVGNLVNPTP